MLFLAALLLTGIAHAQQFDYTVSCDTTGTYQELSAQTLLNSNNSSWAPRYKIPIGFSFHYLGRNFDSLWIETNGYLVLDEDRNYAFTAFNSFMDKIDANGDHAVLGYNLSGDPGSRVLKLQFKKVGQTLSTSEHLSYQVWLKEDSVLEVHVGPHSYTPGYNAQHAVRIGLINMNMDTETRGYFIGGENPSQPQGQYCTDNTPTITYLQGIPATHTRYRFTPSN